MVEAPQMKLLIPVNEDNLIPKLYERFMEIYSKLADIQLIVMSNKPEALVAKIPEGLPDPLIIKNEFNYSRAINSVLKTLDPEEIVVISDPASVISLWQVNEELGNIDFDQEYIYVKTFEYDKDFGTAINYDSQRFMASIINRVIRMKSPVETLPAIVSKPSVILRYINGLEEGYTTSASLINLRRKMKQFGLQETESQKLGLYVGDIPQPMRTEIGQSLTSGDDGFIFIPNNYKRKFGDEDDTSKLEPETKLAIDPVTVPVAKTPPKKPEFKWRPGKVKRRLNSIAATTIDIDNTGPVSNILLAIQTTPKHMIAVTPLMKMLKNEGCSVDMLCNDKLVLINNLIPPDLINNKFDITDTMTSIIPYKKYTRVVRTVGCNINIPVNVPIVDCNKSPFEHDITARNSQVVKQILGESAGLETALPSCAYTVPKKRIPDNVIAICTSKAKGSNLEWKRVPNLISLMSKKYPSRTVVLYSLLGEQKYIDTSGFKLVPNIVDMDRLSLIESSGFIRYSQVSIVGTDSQAFWLSYGLKAQTVAFGPDNMEFPDAPWVTRFKSGDNIDIAEVMGEACKRM